MPGRPSFSLVCRLGAAALLLPVLALLLHPPLVFRLLGIDGGASAELLTRRAGVLLLGVAVTLWLAREAAPSVARRAVTVGVAVPMLALAALGAAEFLRGAAGPGIWVAVATEAAIGLGLVSTLRTGDAAAPRA